ncbi:MAG: gliding motility-associated C-terminal domain-containing protein [Flavobacteriales bacterium]
MMKYPYLKIFILAFSILLCTEKSTAQLAAVPIEVDITPLYGNYGEAGVDLTGYCMYEVYVVFTGPGNYLQSIFAAEGIPDCVQDTDSAAYFDFPCGLFQHELETSYGFTNTCFYNFNAFPTTEFDSFLTISKNCSSDASCDILISSLGQCATWLTDFEGTVNGDYFDGGSFFWDEHAVFVASCLNSGSASYAGADNRVKIAQFTSCGDISGCLNLSYKTQAMVDANDPGTITVFDKCFDAAHPCLANPMDNTAAVGGASCFGEENQVLLSDGGNGLVDYLLYTNADVLVATYNDQGLGLTITPINAGSYYIAMTDDAGCRDTTAVFEVTEPVELQMDAILLQDVMCFGEATAQIEITCSGGTGDVVVVAAGQQHQCGDIITDLGCGSYIITATDENDCSVSETINVSCPAQMLYNPNVTVIPCFGYDNGSIIGNVTGGTGTITAEWNYEGQPFDDFTGNSPLNITIANLDGGTYDVVITDGNGCEIIDSFEITEPEEFSQTSVITDATCNTFCDGTIVYEIIGGTAPYSITCNENGGGVADIDALCAGDYTTVISDDNGCLIQHEFTVGEPTPITYEIEIVEELCFNDCNAKLLLNNVQGSFGGYTYSLTPNSGNCTPPCSGNSVEYTDLCAGNYEILITDQNGCEELVENLILTPPGELEILLNPQNVTCFGLANGEIEIDNSGGTEPFVVTPGNLDVPATVTDLAPGTYTYTITDVNGCTDTEDAIITEPELLVATVTATTDASCGGNCDGIVMYTVVGGTMPYDYVLTPTGLTGAVNGTVTSLCSDAYVMIVSDLFNCEDSIEFEIGEPDPLAIDIALNAPTCTGMFDGDAVVTVSGGTGDLTLFIEPETLSWVQLDSVTYEFTGLGEGVIDFELNDEADCSLQLSQPVVPDIITDMVLTTYSSPETCWNMVDGTATIGVQNGNLPITYLWNDDYAQLTATAVGLASNQSYTVIVTDAIGCTLTEEVFVDPTVGCFFISTGITPNGDGVNDFWVLGGLEFYPDADITVVNRWGQMVFQSKGYTAQWDGTYKNEPLPVADYYFSIDYADDKDPIQGTVTIKY